MELRHYHSAEDFLSDNPDFEQIPTEEKVINNLFLGVLGAIQKGHYEDKSLWAVKAEDGKTALAALQTPPHKIILTAGTDQAVSFFARALAGQNFALPGVVGPAAESAAFVAAWTAATGEAFSAPKKLIYLGLEKDDRCFAPNSSVRLAHDDDMAWLPEWMQEFAIEAGSHVTEEAFIKKWAAHKVKAGHLMVLEKEGTPLSFCGYSPIGEGGARIGPVYTPPALRGKGHATESVTALTRHLFGAGCDWCGLFADEKNPTARGIYEKIGYQARFSYHEYERNQEAG